MIRAVGVAAVALIAGAGPPTPQQPFQHPRLFVLPAFVQGGPGFVQGIGTVGFERDVGETTDVAMYAPQGTSITLGQAPGTVVGTPGVRLEAGGTTLAYNPRRGGLVVADPSSYANQACAPGVHAAVWLLQASPTKDYGAGPLPDVPVALPIYVDRIAPTQANLFSSYELQACFSGAGWPSDAVVRRISLNFSPGVVTEQPAQPGTFDWRGVFTTAGAAGTVESRAILRLPVALTLKGVYTRGKRAVAVTGTLAQGGEPVGGDAVVVWYGSKLGEGWSGIAAAKRSIVHTTSAGRISLTIAATRPTYVRASLTTQSMVYVDSTGCAGPSLATGGCLTATTSGFTLLSALVRVPPTN